MCVHRGPAFGFPLDRQPKVHNLNLAGRRDVDVRGLDVAMDEALTVRVIQREADLPPKLGHHAWRRGDERVQRAALDVLDHQIRPLVILADVVDRHDVRVVQARGGQGFALKPLARRIVHIGKQHFDRNGALKARVQPAIDGGRGASPSALNFVAIAAFANHQASILVRSTERPECTNPQRDVQNQPGGQIVAGQSAGAHSYRSTAEGDNLYAGRAHSGAIC